MLAEALEYLLTPASREARQLGYLRESIAFGARARRCRRAWEPHLSRCRDFLQKCLALHPETTRIIVLGSGHLQETPAHHLRGIRECILVDVVFPLSLRISQWRRRLFWLRHRQFPATHVKLRTTDLLGISRRLLEMRPRDPLPSFVPPAWNFRAADIVVSPSLLSQICLLPRDWVIRHDGHDAPTVEAWMAELLQAHLNWLQSLPCPVVLWCDTAFITADASGHELHRANPWQKWPENLPPPDATWQWTVAPIGEISRDFQRLNQVCAWHDVRSRKQNNAY